jgi:hypothetical protein
MRSRARAIIGVTMAVSLESKARVRTSALTRYFCLKNKTRERREKAAERSCWVAAI